MPGWGADAMIPAWPHVLAVTGLAAVAAVPLGVGLARLPAGWAATLALFSVLLGLLPLPGVGVLTTDTAAVLPCVALPLGWGLRCIPAATWRVAASLAAPARVAWRVWLPLALPWLLIGLALGFVRALAGAEWVWLAALAVIAWPMLRWLAARAAS